MKQLLVRLLRIPPRPEAPPGSPSSIQAFRASPKYLEYLTVSWGVNQLFAALGLAFTLVGLPLLHSFGIEIPWLSRMSRMFWFHWAESLAVVGFLLQLVFGLFLLRLRYELRWYLVSDRALRIREGLFRVREQTLTVANIQNMKVTQGPLQRLFGISDLLVSTAGGGDTMGEEGDGGLHRGVLKGLADAEDVRNRIRDAIARYRDSGLGDPDDRSGSDEVAPSEDPTLARAAENLLRASRELRVALVES